MRKSIVILMVEDNPIDVELTLEAFGEGKLNNVLHVVEDGAEALEFLHKRGAYADSPTPDIVLLDLNLPKIPGRDVLAEIKSNDILRTIPVIILSSSEDSRDIQSSYALSANSFVTKPVNVSDFLNVIKSIEHFWIDIVTLPDNN
jgi:two-component system, chemotaxis family, response regulator Rcp1